MKNNAKKLVFFEIKDISVSSWVINHQRENLLSGDDEIIYYFIDNKRENFIVILSRYSKQLVLAP